MGRIRILQRANRRMNYRRRANKMDYQNPYQIGCSRQTRRMRQVLILSSAHCRSQCYYSPICSSYTLMLMPNYSHWQTPSYRHLCLYRSSPDRPKDPGLICGHSTLHNTHRYWQSRPNYIAVHRYNPGSHCEVTVVADGWRVAAACSAEPPTSNQTSCWHTPLHCRSCHTNRPLHWNFVPFGGWSYNSRCPAARPATGSDIRVAFSFGQEIDVIKVHIENSFTI